MIHYHIPIPFIQPLHANWFCFPRLRRVSNKGWFKTVMHITSKKTYIYPHRYGSSTTSQPCTYNQRIFFSFHLIAGPSKKYWSVPNLHPTLVQWRRLLCMNFPSRRHSRLHFSHASLVSVIEFKSDIPHNFVGLSLHSCLLLNARKPVKVYYVFIVHQQKTDLRSRAKNEWGTPPSRSFSIRCCIITENIKISNRRNGPSFIFLAFHYPLHPTTNYRTLYTTLDPCRLRKFREVTCHISYYYAFPGQKLRLSFC